MNTNENGSGLLRATIAAVNAGDTIQLAPNVTGTIVLNSEMFSNKSLSITGLQPVSIEKLEAKSR